MIMWELMIGRRPFWDRIHNTELIIEICDSLRPPIITNAPEGYIDLMKECWYPDPEKRPKAIEISEKIGKIYNNENYGIIPYMAPEIFQGQKYTKESDIYSFGMIMWEFMTARRPFWDRNHDIDLIIEICDGLRPPIVTNAPEGYIELMKECWYSDPKKRPTATEINKKIGNMCSKEYKNRNSENQTKIIESSDIGPVTINNPGAIYKSRPLSGMINSVMSLRSSRSQSTVDLKTGKQIYCITFF